MRPRATSGGVHDAEIVLRLGVTVLGREAEFRYRRGEILRHAMSVGIHHAEIAVCQDVTLGCRETIPFQRLGIILSDASAAFVPDPEIVLRVRFTPLTLPRADAILRPRHNPAARRPLWST